MRGVNRQRVMWCLALAAGGWLSIAAGRVAGEQPEAPKPATDSRRAAADLAIPDDLRIGVSLEDGAAWRAHGPTKRLVAALSDAASEIGTLPRRTEAWKELSGILGMEDGPAFDALLGRRVFVGVGGAGKAGEDGANESWGVLTSISAEVMAQLETKLDPAPRGFEDGRQVLLVERGKFRLSRMAAAADGGGGALGEPKLVRMLLTPAEAPGSLELMTRSARSLDAWPKEAGRATVFTRLGEGAGGGGAYVISSIARTEHGWAATLKGSAEAAGLTSRQCEALAARGEGEWPAHEGTLLEIAGRVPESLWGLRGAMKPVETMLQAARISAPGGEVMGDRMALRVSRTEKGLEVLVACEVRDVTLAAPELDGVMAALVDFAGRVERAAANTTLRDEIDRAKGDPSAVRLAVMGGAGGTLAWVSVADAGGKSGWWVLQMKPGVGRDEAERSLRENAAEVAKRAWGRGVLWVRAKPAELWNAARDAGAAAPAFMREVEAVELRIEAAGAGIAGEASMTATPERAGRK